MSFLSSCFQYFCSALSFYKFNYETSWHRFLWIYPIWFLSASLMCSFIYIYIYILPNLSSFGHYFLKYFFSPTHLFFWDYNDRNISSFVINLQFQETIVPRIIYFIFQSIISLLLKLGKFF